MTNWKMIVKYATTVLLLNCVPFVISFHHEKLLLEKVWRQRCVRNAVVLNDCNWCWCSANFRYTCNARVCGEVDMFGHFNDAIDDIKVGMEGHGVWRSSESACEPGVPYHRDDLLCICTEDGTWPNPVCRDTFRVLHSVEVENSFKLTTTQQCSPTKLYLTDCNVCFCPSSGFINPNLCTQHDCSNERPIAVRSEEKKNNAGDVYASCDVNRKYKIGCRTCTCLRNNRLLCDECKESQCTGRRPGENFKVDCDTCHCDESGIIVCTSIKCSNSTKELQQFKHIKTLRQFSKRPKTEIDCEPGTRFEKDCNTCYCFQPRGRIKKYACTVKNCNSDYEEEEECDIEDERYKECQLCHCGVMNGMNMEICQTDPECVKKMFKRTLRYRDFPIERCEPLEEYKNGCNTCHCSANGRSIRCTDKPCDSEPVYLDIIPVIKKLPSCPKGQSYKIDCNICYCMSNGNALCTTLDCNSKTKKLH